VGEGRERSYFNAIVGQIEAPCAGIKGSIRQAYN
jgi:hypothetical protein